MVRVRGTLYTKRFKPTASQAEMQDWRAAIRVDALRREAKRSTRRIASGSFAEDVETYLKAVTTMPTYAEREAHLRGWVTAIGNDDKGKPRKRSDITSDEIRAILQGWRLRGKRKIAHVFDWRTRRPIIVELGHVPMSESACNHRRTALMHLYTVLDGKSAVNPVRDVPRFREADPEPRGIPMAVVQTILDAMPDSATKARCLVMAWTGLPHATLMQIKPEHVQWETQTVYVPRRRKGKGTKARVMPLLPQGVHAFRQMATFEAWGAFSRDSLRGSLHRACDKVGVPRIRPYDLRHSFGTAAYEASGDIRAVQVLLDHSDAKLTARYTLGAVDVRVQATLDAMGRKHTSGVTSTGNPPEKTG